MGLTLLAMLFGLTAIVLATCYALLWLAARFVHPSLAAILGTTGVALMAYAIVDGMISCNAPPIEVPPRPGDLGEGSLIYACDGPGGVAIYMGIFIVYPFFDLCLAFITYRIWRAARIRREKDGSLVT